jgi:hypothetical protein
MQHRGRQAEGAHEDALAVAYGHRDSAAYAAIWRWGGINALADANPPSATTDVHRTDGDGIDTLSDVDSD